MYFFKLLWNLEGKTGFDERAYVDYAWFSCLIYVCVAVLIEVSELRRHQNKHPPARARRVLSFFRNGTIGSTTIRLLPRIRAILVSSVIFR